MIRLHRPDGPVALGIDPDDYEQPRPIQIRKLVQWTPKGPATDYSLVWRADDARECRACPLEACSFAPCSGDTRVGTCFIRRLPGEPAYLEFTGEPAF